MDRPEKVTRVQVYTNQSKVTLYNNGKKIAEKTGEHVFEFEVPLSAENKLKAVAGGYQDTAVLRRVDKPNPAYKLTAKSSNSANWV